ncbi:MAG: YozE family protein [Vagococcus sp.]|uniref:YozE family protein n=1 Tax=Vagococcus sp. TaxID=1933889 RepID=UPI002FC655AD
MKRSFYHYVQTFRGKTHQTDESKLAEDIFHDLQFPKQSHSYDEISHYLETNAYYIPNMDIFDSLWEHYIENN